MRPEGRLVTIFPPALSHGGSMAARRKGAARARFKLASPDIRPNGPIAMEQGFNGFGGPGWGGPCPPAGDKPHRYNFTLYALKVDGLDVSGASASLVGYMINANAIGKAKLTGKFGRKK